jgi:hypothetical protein
MSRCPHLLQGIRLRQLPRLGVCFVVAALFSACDTQKAAGPSPVLDRLAADEVTDRDRPAPLVLHLVAPAATDPAIDQGLDNHYVWLDSTAKSNHKLLVFMPATRTAPAGYQLVEQEAARLGYHVIGLMYANSVGLFTVCFDAACWENARLEVLDGIDRTSVVNVNVANSINNRLAKLLQFLAVHYPREGWSRFLKEGKPRWSRIVVAGHSQGGGEAVIIAKILRVAGVVLFEAPPDGGGRPAVVPIPWMSTHVTPASRYYGLEHDRSVFYPADQANWNLIGLPAFGAPVNTEASAPPYDFTHMLITDLMPRGGYSGVNAHFAVVADAQTPLASDGTPLLQNTWRYLLTTRGNDEEDDADDSDRPGFAGNDR